MSSAKRSFAQSPLKTPQKMQNPSESPSWQTETGPSILASPFLEGNQEERCSDFGAQLPAAKESYREVIQRANQKVILLKAKNKRLMAEWEQKARL